MRKIMLAAFALGAAVAIATFGNDTKAQVATPGLRQVPLGYCQIGTLSSAVLITPATCVGASFTATGSGTNLTVSSVTGVLKIGAGLAGTGVPTGTYIVSQTSGTTGGAGVYVTSGATTSSAASLTSGGVVRGSTSAYIQIEAQAVRYRDDGAAPTTSVGMPIPAAGSLLYAGTLSAVRIIEVTSGAKANILQYR